MRRWRWRRASQDWDLMSASLPAHGLGRSVRSCLPQAASQDRCASGRKCYISNQPRAVPTCPYSISGVHPFMDQQFVYAAPLLGLAGITTEFSGVITTQFCFGYFLGASLLCGLHTRLCYAFLVFLCHSWACSGPPINACFRNSDPWALPISKSCIGSCRYNALVFIYAPFMITKLLPEVRK